MAVATRDMKVHIECDTAELDAAIVKAEKLLALTQQANTHGTNLDVVTVAAGAAALSGMKREITRRGFLGFLLT
jgi:selenocysteine lyase/cysteine desulfurase